MSTLKKGKKGMKDELCPNKEIWKKSFDNKDRVQKELGIIKKNND